MPSTKRDNWTLTEPTVEPVSNCNIMENCVQQNSPRKRSVAVWTVESGNLENSSLLANRVQVKKKSMTDLRKSEKSPTKNGNAIACGNGAKSEYYSTFCETLKLDRKGERENPFAGKLLFDHICKLYTCLDKMYNLQASNANVCSIFLFWLLLLLLLFLLVLNAPALSTFSSSPSSSNWIINIDHHYHHY